jgi:uncharacterized protein (TIGR04168 family)
MIGVKVALIGDLHSSWDAADAKYFNGSDYELLLFTGDLGSGQRRDGVELARSLSRLNRPTLVMLGNNDATEHARISAELSYQQGRARLLEGTPSWRPGLANVRPCGFDAHRFELGGLDLTVVCGRPFAMGNGELSYAEALQASYGVRSAADASDRLKALVDAAETEQLIFLAHNGPRGLGAEADAPWGRDFHPEAGDWGDLDLAEAIEHARAKGRRVLAVVAGHMHWTLRSGGTRRWQRERDGTLYVNAARVPRILQRDGRKLHHHIELLLSNSGAQARDVALERRLD